MNSSFVSEMNVYYVTPVLKQDIKIKSMCLNYIVDERYFVWTRLIYITYSIVQDTSYTMYNVFYKRTLHRLYYVISSFQAYGYIPTSLWGSIR